MIPCIRLCTQPNPTFRGRISFPLYEPSTRDPNCIVTPKEILTFLNKFKAEFPEYEVKENTFMMSDEQTHQSQQMGEFYISKKIPPLPWYLKPFGFVLRYQARSTEEGDKLCLDGLVRLGLPPEKIKRDTTYLKPEIRPDNLFTKKISHFA